ncbi:hypothetical protein HA402_009782 [Bradysia odoriphaga]|nr:hypothetical protein HA402_009782 [Bradysia odoriphaga]
MNSMRNNNNTVDTLTTATNHQTDNLSEDVVDFVKSDTCNLNHNNNNIKTKPPIPDSKSKQHFGTIPSISKKKLTGNNLYGDAEVRSCVKSSFSTLENLSLFQFPRKKSDPSANQSIAAKERPKFVKSASIARLFGNTYSTKRGDANAATSATVSSDLMKSLPTPERFQKCSENFVDEVRISDFSEDKDIGVRAFKSISKGLGRLLFRKSHSVDISAPDPEFKVSYLGNVLTGWAKGDSCIEKPLATLWRNYTQNNKPDVIMRVRVCPSGLKATTRQHGLTEYWSHRVTHCSAPKNYPRVFCWIYRHEGRKLKHELRCHAVLCAKESIAEEISNTLKENLSRALKEFKRDKINRQNARLSLVNSVYENPSMPRRKIMLSVGANNYRPPLERSKSAPRLMAIEEAIGEEDEDDDEEKCSSRSKESRSCCTVDPLYPAMTLGRRRCKRGHSIRRTGTRNRRLPCEVQFKKGTELQTVIDQPGKIEETEVQRLKSVSSTGSDDDLDKLLLCNNYDSESPLAGELMSYFDMKFNTKTASLADLQESQHFNLLSNSGRNTLSLDDLDAYSDGEGEEVFYNQQNILDLLVQQSSLGLASCNDSSNDNSLSSHNHGNDRTKASGLMSMSNSLPIVLDSDEGSISSGCETASTVTNLEEPSKTGLDIEPNSLESNSAASDLSVETTITRVMRNKINSSSRKDKNDDSDSEYSDESGYVEYQEKMGCRSKSILI